MTARSNGASYEPGQTFRVVSATRDLSETGECRVRWGQLEPLSGAWLAPQTMVADAVVIRAIAAGGFVYTMLGGAPIGLRLGLATNLAGVRILCVDDSLWTMKDLPRF